jgi:NAD(P)H-hydrate epimerase
MRELDRVAVEEMGLGILQMMENAGRQLASTAIEMIGTEPRIFAVLAGGGGNGGGGLCCARHLLNHGAKVFIVLDRPDVSLAGPALRQYGTLAAAGHRAAPWGSEADLLAGASLVIDALIGYSLRGAPRGRAAELIRVSNRHARAVLSLDLPSGLDGSTGQAPGDVVRADRVLTLALPKNGLRSVDAEVSLADIGIPPLAYARVGVDYRSPFGDGYVVRLLKACDGKGDG